MGETSHAYHVRPGQGSSRRSPSPALQKTGHGPFLGARERIMRRLRALIARRRGHSKSVRLADSGLCKLCKNIKINDSDLGGHVETSEGGQKYLEAPNSEVPILYHTFPTLQPFSTTADAGCPLCQLLEISFIRYFGNGPKGPVDLEGVMIKELKYVWDSGLRSLQVDFCYAREGFHDDHHIEFPIEAFPGRMKTSSSQRI